MGCQEDGRWKEITSGNTTGLFRYFVLFVIDVKTRRVEIAGINHQRYEEWMKQIARNLTDITLRS